MAESELVVKADTELQEIKELSPADKQLVKKEATEILAKIARETNIDKTKDLTYLFQVNHTKQALMRQQVLDNTMDAVVNELNSRVKDHPEEFDTETLLKTATTIQAITDKNVAGITTQAEAPKSVIDVHPTEIHINTGSDGVSASGLTRDQRKNVDEFVSSILKGAIKPDTQNRAITEEKVEVVETTEETKDEG